MIFEIGTELLPPGPKWEWDPKRPVSGTTKFYVRVAEALVRKGHSVSVLWSQPDLTHNGVRYVCDPERKGHASSEVIIDCNLQRERAAAWQKRLQWTSFFGRRDTCIGEGYDRLFLVSDYVHSTLSDVVKCPVTVLELGCEMATVENPMLSERPKVCCYTSSPDRGGHFLAAMWPEVEKATGYRLEISHYHASFTDEKLQALYDRSRFWLYPALGTDSIVSTLEAQARGCIPFYVPHMGLPQTVRYGIKTQVYRFKDDLITALKTAPEFFPQWETERAVMLDERPIPTWDDVTEGILRAL